MLHSLALLWLAGNGRIREIGAAARPGSGDGRHGWGMGGGDPGIQGIAHRAKMQDPVSVQLTI